jgi:uncharacterized protein (UPF0248 family)
MLPERDEVRRRVEEGVEMNQHGAQEEETIPTHRIVERMLV